MIFPKITKVMKYTIEPQPTDLMHENITLAHPSPTNTWNTVTKAHNKESKLALGDYPLIKSKSPFSLNLTLPAKNCIPNKE